MNEEINVSELCRIIRVSVGDAVHKAVTSPEVREIKDTMKSVVREVADELGTQFGTGTERPRVYKTPTAPPPPPPEVSGPPMWKGSPRGLKVKGNMMMVFGSAGVLLGVGLLAVTAVAASAVLSFASGVAQLAGWGLFSLIPAGVLLAFAGMVGRGKRSHGMGSRYQKYIAAIGPAYFCPIKMLSEAVRKSERFVQKDLARMIKAGMFPEGQLDSKNATLILDAETYRHYQETQQRQQQEQRETRQKETQQPQNAELEATLTEGREYMRRMRLANDLIDGKEISRKLDRIEQVGGRILEHVEQHPQKLPDIRRLMSYYLPITLKLVEGYCKFDNQPVQGGNITAAKKEIEETLDTIALAFENLLDSLFQRDAMDLSSDISALEAMLAQEGLTGSDFQTSPKE